jgi:hypothetical protein
MFNLDMSLTPITQPNPNPEIIRNLNAVSTMVAYPLATNRTDMTQFEWTKYKVEWKTFEDIWIYNYGVSTINGLEGGVKRYPWQYLSFSERNHYINGQQAHLSYYSNAPAGQFNNISFN